jgi:ATP-dependent Lon protease
LIEYSYTYKFIGILNNEDPWFPKWDPNGTNSQINSPVSNPKSTTRLSNIVNIPIKENVIKIKKDEIGHTYESLLGTYLYEAKEITIQDSYLEAKYQFQNLIRFMELCVKIGTIKKINLTTKKIFEKESLNRLQKSMLSNGINLTWSIEENIHDRFIETDTGWHIHLGFGLDIYQKPNDYDSIGASDFSLRPCKETIISINRKTEPLAS